MKVIYIAGRARGQRSLRRAGLASRYSDANPWTSSRMKRHSTGP